MREAINEVTARICRRSLASRKAYLERMAAAAAAGKRRGEFACSNLAHGMAGCNETEKARLSGSDTPNLAIVTAYNDMLSAHKPYEDYPSLIRQAAESGGAVAQVAGGVPAMCDGVTQGEAGMELSLFSRDVIAMSTAVALSHNLYDGVFCLGVCDKIVPGMLMGTLAFGHLPVMFVPAGPMPSGISNGEKATIREQFASGQVDRGVLLAAESAAYHSPGTCTFYGTANSNQMLLEIMGLQLPGGSFVNPDSQLRDCLTREAVGQMLETIRDRERFTPLSEIVGEKTIVNAMVGLLATGGSTNHTIHLIAVAAAAGIVVDWSDIASLSAEVPQIASLYPSGTADVNQFQHAGGMGCVITELLDGGFLHEDVSTVMGQGLRRFCLEPTSDEGNICWKPAGKSSDYSVLRSHDDPFSLEGGIRVVEGAIGRAVVKVSAVAPEFRRIEAPAQVFHSQDAFVAAFEAGELNRDVVVVLPGQGPKAAGMPELHRLSPFLGVLQNQGYRVALLTDGRMSGASGKVLSAIHVTPEAADDGQIGRIRDGDSLVIDADLGLLEVNKSLMDRSCHFESSPDAGCGRELFGVFRDRVSGAEQGATVLGYP